MTTSSCYRGLLLSLLLLSVNCFKGPYPFRKSIFTTQCISFASDADTVGSQSALNNCEDKDITSSVKEAFKRGQEIEVTIRQFGPLGASVDINDQNIEAKGLILQSEINYFRERRYINAENDGDVLIGEVLPAFVERVREDGKVDVALRPVGVSRMEVVGDMIMDALEGSPSGIIPIGDKSSPDDIGAYIHGISKKDFKSAVGRLYKNGKVLPGKFQTTLVPEEERTSENFEKNRISKKNVKLKGAKDVEGNAEADTDDSNTDNSTQYKGRRLADLLQGPNYSQSRDESKTIFVGNLPFSRNGTILENTVKKIMGPEKIVSIRLAYDRDTQKPRGFGYIEFHNDEDVEVALKKLKGVEVMGRKLRVDYSEPSSPNRIHRHPIFHDENESHDAGDSVSNDRSVTSHDNQMNHKEIEELDELAAFFEELDDRIRYQPIKEKSKLRSTSSHGGDMRSHGEYNKERKDKSNIDGDGGRHRSSQRRSDRPPEYRNSQRPDATLFVGNLPYAVDENILRQEFEKVLGLGTVAGARIATEKGTDRKRGFGYVDLWDRKLAYQAIDEMHGRHSIMGRTINVDDATRGR